MQRFKSTGYRYVAGKVPLTGIGVTQICNYGMQDSGESCSKEGGNFGGVLILAAIMSKFAAYLLHVTICVRKKS